MSTDNTRTVCRVCTRGPKKRGPKWANVERHIQQWWLTRGVLERPGGGGWWEGDDRDGEAYKGNEFVTNRSPSHSALCFLTLLLLVARMCGEDLRWTELSQSDSSVRGNEWRWSMWGIFLVWFYFFHPFLILSSPILVIPYAPTLLCSSYVLSVYFPNILKK